MCEDKVIKIELKELVYLCFISLMFLAKGFGLYDGQVIYKLVLLIALSLATVKILITDYTKKEWFFIVLSLFFTMVIYLNCKEKGIVICVLTVILMKGVSLDKVLKTGLWVWSIAMSCNILYHLLNLDTSGYKVHNKLGMELIFRWDLGFSHPNVLHISYLVLVGLIICNLKKNYGWKHFLMLSIGNLYIFLYSLSYTGFTVTMLYLILVWYADKRQYLNKMEYWLLGAVFPVALVVSFCSVFFLPDKIFNILNRVFNNRLILAKYYLIPENIKIFGNNLESITTGMYTLDNSYLFSFIIYGIIVFAVLVVLYMCMMKEMIVKKKNKELVLTACMLIAGITEPFLFNSSFKNLTLFFLGAYLWKEAEKKNETRALWAKPGKKVVNINISGYLKASGKAYKLWLEHKRSILLCSIILSIVIGSIFGITKEMPGAYIVPRVHADVREVNGKKELWTLENPDDPKYENVKILSYTDDKTYMEYINGDVLVMERIRLCISSILILGIFFTGIGFILVAIKERPKTE